MHAFYNNVELCWITAEAAQKELRKRGVVLASKKSSRTAAEGLLALAQNRKKAVVVELNCETDFVARNDIFQYLVSIRFGSSRVCSIVSNCLDIAVCLELHGFTIMCTINLIFTFD